MPALLLAACGDGGEEATAGNGVVPAPDGATVDYAPAEPATSSERAGEAGASDASPLPPAAANTQSGSIGGTGDAATPMGTGMSTEDVTGNGMITNETSDRGR
ncbi:hypothetical protein FBR43_01140 [Sphingomonas baiyangensis]|uniref:Uncharacterized protein n=2 Tax=Sphingomonas baiyangensis TaxID=2572576 RepID=A0A4U1L7S1_9SPHN|nr:hypothetical protein FBR43_01140 [Sphingomonas baiyangensis]